MIPCSHAPYCRTTPGLELNLPTPPPRPKARGLKFFRTHDSTKGCRRGSKPKVIGLPKRNMAWRSEQQDDFQLVVAAHPQRTTQTLSLVAPVDRTTLRALFLTAPAYSQVSRDMLCPPSVHQTHIEIFDLHLFDYEEFVVYDEGIRRMSQRRYGRQGVIGRVF